MKNSMTAHNVETFFDKATSTLTYVVYDVKTKDAVIIDPVLDYDPASGAISHESVDQVLSFIDDNKLNLHVVLETHAHADHLTGALEIKKRRPNVKVAIGENIDRVQEVFKGAFNLKGMNTDGSQFDLLLNEKQDLQAGSINIKTIFTPGHTPACSSYLIEDKVFTGDALFMPDSGTGRCDFPAGSSKDLYHSIHEKLYNLPDETKVFTGHDYQPGGREVKWESTIGENKKVNTQLSSSTGLEEFVKMRDARDTTLEAPKLLLPSIQVNIKAGELPQAEDNGTSYLKIPLRLKGE
jgi:glyoxylase-like metal-dependent hydrolase (beta-lactamase superfamily II)